MMQNPISADEIVVHDDISALLANRTNYRQEIQRLADNSRYVVFYGCGAIFSSIVDTWQEYVGRPIDFCCDSDPDKWGKSYCGAKCLSPQELLEIKSECAVFVTIGKFQPVFNFLRSEGFPSVHLIYKYDLVASAFLDEQDNEVVATKLRLARSGFSDQRSVQVFDTILRRVLGRDRDIGLMPSICDPHQYFVPDIVRLSARECYVDIGAYDGDTIGQFIAATQGNFETIHAFELEPLNYHRLKENVRHMPHHDRITTFNLGIWDRECDINFSVAKTQSTLGVGESSAHVVPLDDILANQRVSFIKMDIEGAEPHALRGARNLIATQKPKLAICVYHHISHLWEIPAYIRQLVPDHRLFLRHYTNLEYETVCYAVPW